MRQHICVSGVVHWVPLFFSKFKAEYYLWVNYGRSCLEVCTADVIRKFQILVWCLNKVRLSSLIEFHPNYVVSVTCLTLYCKFCQCSASEEVGAYESVPERYGSQLVEIVHDRRTLGRPVSNMNP